MATDAGTRFTLPDYGSLVQELLGRGYGIVDYEDADPNARHLVLRHDVDFDLDAAVTMAEFEQQRGWRSCYFLLLRTEFYNPLSARGEASIRRLVELEHDVGLHFDASLYDGDEGVLMEAVERECRILETITERPVAAFSLHRPNLTLLDHGFEVSGRINAYAARYFREMGYCSDSRGDWSHGHPLDHPAVAQRRAIQLLTHPIWWTGRIHVDSQAKLEAFLTRRRDLLDREIAAHCTVYRPASDGSRGEEAR